jgi:SPP1 family predicted phage head-tail adaptor
MIPTGSGSLRNSVVLYSSTVAKNAYGEDVATWASYDTVWASIRPVSSRESESAMQTVGTVSHEVVIRYLSTVSIKHRAYFGTRVLEIASIANKDERNEYLTLLCNEVLA